MKQADRDAVLDAAAELVTADGYDATNLDRVAARSGIDRDRIIDGFGTTQEMFVAMLNREFLRMRTMIADHVDRDPRGGLLSRIYRYSLSAVYESPLARTLWLTDPRTLNGIMRASNGFTYVPDFSVRSDFIERMQAVGMVRRDADPERLSALLAAVSAGVALTSPRSEVDLVTEGLVDLLAAAVDADVENTEPGKAAFIDYVLSLAATRPRH